MGDTQGSIGPVPGIYGIIVNAESGGQNVVNPIVTSSGNAGGYFQITQGTWNDFAGRAGVDLGQYPSATDAPYSVQQAVADQIPLNRWAGSTVNAVETAYPGIDTSQPLGVLAQQTGSSGTALLAGAADQSSGALAGPASMVQPAMYLPPYAEAPGIGVPVVPVPQGILAQGNVFNLGENVTKQISAWINNALGSIESWVERGFILTVGIVLIGVAVFALAFREARPIT